MIELKLIRADETAELTVTLPVSDDEAARLSCDFVVANVETGLYVQNDIKKSITLLNRYARLVADELDENEIKTFAALYECLDDYLTAEKVYKSSAYHCIHDVYDEYDLGRAAVDEGLFYVCKECEHYIDYERLGHDLSFDYYISSHGVAVCIDY